MISGLIFTLFTLTAICWLIATRKKMETEDGDFNSRWLVLPILIFVVGGIISLTQPFTVERVDAGHIGIKVNLTGNERGVSKYAYKTGWVIYNTWTEMLYEFPTFQQHIEYSDQTVITKGGFSAVIKPTFNYSLKPEAVGEMFQELRLDIKSIEQGWLMTAIVGSVMDVANRWEIDKIFNEREQFESAIVNECNKRVAKWFVISQLRTNIMLPAALQQAIVDKTKAVQETQAKEQEALVAIANAEKLIQTAKGDSAKAVIDASGVANAMLIKAEAEAKAMKLKQAELNATYIEYIKWSNWNGVLPTTSMGSNVTPLINVK